RRAAAGGAAAARRVAPARLAGPPHAAAHPRPRLRPGAVRDSRHRHRREGAAVLRRGGRGRQRPGLREGPRIDAAVPGRGLMELGRGVVRMSALQTALDQIAFARRYTLGLLEGVPEAEWFRMPAEGVTHVA